MMDQNKTKQPKKNWLAKLFEKWDKKLEEKSKDSSCCKTEGGSKGSSCC